MIGNLIDLMLADSSITAYVGTRIYPVHQDQDADLPAISVIITDLEPTDTKTDVSRDDFIDVDVISYGRSAVNAFRVADTVRNVIDNFSGDQGDSTFLAIRLEGMNMSHYPPDDIYTVVSEYRVHLRR